MKTIFNDLRASLYFLISVPQLIMSLLLIMLMLTVVAQLLFCLPFLPNSLCITNHDNNRFYVNESKTVTVCTVSKRDKEIKPSLEMCGERNDLVQRWIPAMGKIKNSQ